jgi:hypothetical protein
MACCWFPEFAAPNIHHQVVCVCLVGLGVVGVEGGQFAIV